MKKYEFQILRYLPDLVSGEFINVGLVVYCYDERFMMAGYLQQVKRIHEFFPGADARHIIRTAKFIKNEIHEISRRWSSAELEFPIPSSLSEVTTKLLPPNDAALFFTETFRGIDLSPEAAFKDLCKRLIYKYVEEPSPSAFTDEDVWNKIYKQHFKEKGLLNQLLPHTVKTAKDRFEFEHTWKNGARHCYEPASFRQQPESIKRKVYNWKGKMQELGTSEEKIKVHLMTALPEKPELKRFVLDMLQGQTFGQAYLELVEPEQASQLTTQLKLDLDEHQHNSREKEEGTR